MQFPKWSVLTLLYTALNLCAAVQPWVERSNVNALFVLREFASFSPEGVASAGLDGFDDRVIDLKPGLYERGQAATKEAIQTLQGRLAAEKDPLVRQDLEI